MVYHWTSLRSACRLQLLPAARLRQVRRRARRVDGRRTAGTVGAEAGDGAVDKQQLLPPVAHAESGGLVVTRIEHVLRAAVHDSGPACCEHIANMCSTLI